MPAGQVSTKKSKTHLSFFTNLIVLCNGYVYIPIIYCTSRRYSLLSRIHLLWPVSRVSYQTQLFMSFVVYWDSFSILCCVLCMEMYFNLIITKHLPKKNLSGPSPFKPINFSFYTTLKSKKACDIKHKWHNNSYTVKIIYLYLLQRSNIWFFPTLRVQTLLLFKKLHTNPNQETISSFILLMNHRRNSFYSACTSLLDHNDHHDLPIM